MESLDMNVGFVVFLSFVFRGNCDESILLSPVERIAPNDLGWAEKSIVALLVDVGVVVDFQKNTLLRSKIQAGTIEESKF